MAQDEWRVESTRRLVDDRWLRLDAERVRTAGGALLDPYYVIHERSWACVVPVLADGRVVVVEQYRHGARRATLELPAGDLDADEPPAVAALRELAEETGYRARGEPVALGALYPEPARNRSLGHGFLARVEAEPAAQRLDPAEDIRIRLLAPAELLAAQADGRFCHAVHVAFLHVALARGLLA